MPEPAEELRLGDLLVTTGRLSREQILAALEWQRQQAGPQRRHLGETLVELGLVSAEEIQTILSGQGKQVLWCPRCRIQVSDQEAAPGARYGCQQCQGELQPAPPPASPVVRKTWPAMAVPSGSSESLSDEVRQALADPSRRIGRYAVLSELGRGGMGVVYRCWDPKLQRLVALKLVLDPDHAGQVQLKRFQRECKTMARLSHPGLVQILDVADHQDQPFIVMELIEGCTFEDAYRNDRPSTQQLAKVMAQVADALHYAHEQGIVHRDVKPGNVLIDTSGKPRLGDFGLVQVADATTRLTRTGRTVGTPGYMAPEQLSNDLGSVGPHSDIYGLGGLLYWGLTGRDPFTGDSLAEVLRRVLVSDVIPPREIEPAIHPDLNRITLRCLSKTAVHRPSTAAELAKDLRRVAQGEKMEQSADHRKPSRLAMVATGLVLAACAIGLGVWLATTADAPRKPDTRALRSGRDPDQQEGEVATTAREQRGSDQIADAAPTLGPGDAAALIHRGNARQAEGDLSEAIADFSRAINIDPLLAGAWLARGKLHKVVGSLRVAMTDFSRAIEIDPNLTEAWLERGNARADLQQSEEAIADFTKAIELDPSSWLSWKNRARQRFKTGDLAGADEDHAKASSLSPNEQLRLGKLKLAAGDHEAAIAAYNKAVELDPSLELSTYLAVAWRDRGAARIKKGNLDGAIADYSRAIEIDPSHPSAWNSRGFARSGKGDLDGAIADYSRAIEIEPKYAAAWFNRASIRHKKGDLDGAIADCTRTLEIAPNFALAWTSRGGALEKKGDLHGAIADFQRLLELAPNDPHAHSIRTKIQKFRAQLAKTRASELNPNDAVAWNNRGTTRAAKGDINGAIADFTRAIEIEPRYGAAWANRAQAWIHKGNLAAAMADYNRALDVEPNNVETWNNRGHAKKAKGDINGAIDDYSRAIEIDPNRPRIWNNRGQAKKAKGDLDGAIADYSRAVEIDPNYAIAWGHRGSLRQDRGDTDGAIADYSRAIEIDPNRPKIWNNRGLLRRDRGDTDGAIDDFTRAIEIKPNFAMAWSNRGNMQRLQGDIDGAIEDYSRALEADPSFALAWYNRGLAREKMGDFEGVIADWQRFLAVAPDHSQVPGVQAKLQKLREQQAKARAGAGK